MSRSLRERSHCLDRIDNVHALVVLEIEPVRVAGDDWIGLCRKRAGEHGIVDIGWHHGSVCVGITSCASIA